jgi:hypothetical protein
MSSNLKVSVSKRKLLLAFFSIALICSLASGSIIYVVAQGGSTPITISSGPYPGAPSYTIYTDGTTTYAKSSSGVISSSTDTTSIFQYAITNGYHIQINDGIYSGLLPLTVPSNRIIEGNGNATKLMGSLLGTQYLFNLIGTVGTPLTGITIKNLYIYCGGANYVSGAIYGYHLYDKIIFQNLVIECGQSGASTASSFGIKIEESNTGIELLNNRIEGFTSYGIYLIAANAITISGGFIGNGYAASAGIRNQGFGNTIENINFGGGGVATVGLLIADGSGVTNVDGCYFEIQQANAIQVGFTISGDPCPVRTTIQNCYFDTADSNFAHIALNRCNYTTIQNCAFNQGHAGIYAFSSNVTYLHVFDVEVIGCDYPVIDAGSICPIYSGAGFENRGIWNVGTGAWTETIAHGLFGAPNVVMLSIGQSSLNALRVSYSGVNATHFIVNCGNSDGPYTGSWEAYYYPPTS